MIYADKGPLCDIIWTSQERGRHSITNSFHNLKNTHNVWSNSIVSFYLFRGKNATCAVSRLLLHLSCVGQYRLKFTVTPDPTLWKFWWYIFVDTWNNSKTNNSKWAANILPDRGLGVLVRKYGDGEIVCWMCVLLVVVGGLDGLERCHLEGC